MIANQQRAVTLLFAVISLMARANSNRVEIDPQNANFHYTLEVGQGSEGFEVAYNSRTLYDGLFGFGWCSDFETRLDLPQNQDASQTQWATVNTCGAGQQFRFKRDPGGNYVPSEGMGKLQSTKEGYLYTNAGNEDERYEFNREGALLTRRKRNGDWIHLTWKQGRLDHVIFNGVTEVHFAYMTDGRVERIILPKGGDVLFTYQWHDNRLLLSAIHWGGRSYSFQYNEVANLTHLEGGGDPPVDIEYDKERDWAVGVFMRGCQQRYRYLISSDSEYRSEVERWCDGILEASKSSTFVFVPGDRPEPAEEAVRLDQIIEEENGFWQRCRIEHDMAICEQPYGKLSTRLGGDDGKAESKRTRFWFEDH